jgi:predicted enzyme related to lactoylglutathione lyase
MEIKNVWVTIAAEEFERSVQFYRQVFEREPIAYRADRYAEFEILGLRLGIYKPRLTEFSEVEFPRMSLCLQVENLDIAIETMKRLGSAIGDVVEASHGRELYAYDPDGNRLILYEPC